ncbi:MAG: histidine kinase [Gammaproteobacteria bacterium]|nr:MAG: histidine kinase [Gammaproteobacteria bacterium]
MNAPSPNRGKELADRVKIPPRPEVLITVMEEAKKEDPDFNRISKALSSDVSLSAAILQVVNSPFFGLRNRISSIQQAMALLGLKKVSSVVRVVSLRNSVTNELELGRFWDTASEVANICGMLAPKLSALAADDAYTLGLFHDCGIPLMMQSFKDYKEVLRLSNLSNVKPRTRIEDRRYGTNHAEVGYELAKKWFLPDHLALAVLNHHRYHELFITDAAGSDLNESDNYEVLPLLAILKMAEQVSAMFRKSLRAEFSDEWEEMGPLILKCMAISEQDYSEIRDDILEQLYNEDCGN